MARTALPMGDAAAVDDAAVLLAGRRILDVGKRRLVLRGFSGPVYDLGEAVLLPGLVNAHSHLELAGLRGLCPPPAGFAAWAAWLVATGRRPPTDALLDRAVAAMAASGTGAVIDVGSQAGPAVAGALHRAGLAGLVCHEAFGWRRRPKAMVPAALDAAVATAAAGSADPPGGNGPVRAAASGHALYSTSPETLHLAREACRLRRAPFCLHLAEHAEEDALLRTGGGALAALLAGSVLPRGYTPPGCSPVAAAAREGLLGPDVLAVHAVWLDAADRRLLAASGTSVCLCPRSNARIGVGTADAAALWAAGVPLCLGTDSLASNDDLDLWNEARALLAAWADLPGRALLAALTTTPARLLGRPGELGCLAPGALGGIALIPEDLRPRLAGGR